MKNLTKWLVTAGMMAGMVLTLPNVADAANGRPDRRRSDQSMQEGGRPFRPLLPTRSATGMQPAKGFMTPIESLVKPGRPAAAIQRVAAKASPVNPDLKLRGSVVSTWAFVYMPGLFYIPATAEGTFEQVEGASIIAEYGAWDDGNGRYYVGGLEDWGVISFANLTVYSTDTWEAIEWPECDHSILCTDNATDPTTKDVYGCYYYYDEEETPHLAWAKADYPNGKSDALRVLGENEQMYGVACDAAGQYYGVLADGSLVKVEKNTGVFTKVGDTGLRPYYNTSAAFDDKSGNIIFAYAPASGKSSLWAIDPATAAATLLVEYENNDQITALEVIKPEAEDLAPAAPQLSAETPGGEMLMNYTITMPSTLFNGNEASGKLHWTLTVDGEQAAEGDSEFGGVVNGSFTLSSAGVHNLVAYVENEVGPSPRTKIQVINGQGTPMAPNGLGINNFGGGEIGLFWNDVTESADGAFVDPKAITYKVARNGTVVAEGLKDTWYDDKVDVPDTFLKLNYEVFAVYGENESEPAVISTGVGSIEPPYNSAFEGEPKDNDLYTVINSNGDNGGWWFSPSYGSFIYDYSTENAADDWLISPAFHLEAGKKYELSYSVSGNSAMYTERYAVAMGVAPVAASMITELLPATEISTERNEPIAERLTIEPKQDGVYYIGWHALSDAGMFQIHLRDIKLTAPLVAGSPAEATDLQLSRDLEGMLKMHGSFKAPAKDFSGADLTAVGRVVVSRDGKEAPVAEFASATPGATLEFDDTDIPEAGTYTYRVTCFGAEGQPGREIAASAYVGPLAPENVPAVDIVEDIANPGYVKLSWEAPAKDIEGNPLNPANLSYMVYVPGDYGMAEPVIDAPINDTNIALKVCEPEEMAFAVFYVSAINLGLESANVTRSDMIPVGKADTLPYRHSFTQSDLESHLMGYVVPAGSYGSLGVGNLENNGVVAADGDDAFMVATQYDANMTLDFFTGKLDLGQAENPALSIRHYKWSDADANSLVAYALTSDGRYFEIGSADHSIEGEVGWNLLVCPLDKVKGEIVKLGVSALFISHNTMLFDAISVADRHDYDMAATSLSAPVRVEPLKEFQLTGNVANFGMRKAENYTVELLFNGESVAKAEGTPVESGESARVEFRHTVSPLMSGAIGYALKVTIDGDGDSSNDVSPTVAPILVESKFPAVADLKAENSAEGVKLSWSEPSTVGYDVKETEDFEEAEAWTEEVEGWTMLDIDQHQIGTIDGAGLPDAVAMRTAHSFFVFDNESEDVIFFNPELKYVVGGNSGSKSLVAMYTLGSAVDQDDWAISPLLSGEAQTLSFYARSFHPEYPDHMEVLYSMSDSTDPADFVTLCPDGAFEVPQLVDAVGNAQYTRYEFQLPAGAKRFALRAHNEAGSGFMLMIDDINFRQANAQLAVVHYDVYRDGVCINAAPVAATSYVDAYADAGKHDYNVIVNYNRGISPASNTAQVSTSGIESVIAAGISVSVEGHEIVVSGAPADIKVALYAADGRMLYSGKGDARIAAASGIYMLAIGDDAVKVMVK